MRAWLHGIERGGPRAAEHGDLAPDLAQPRAAAPDTIARTLGRWMDHPRGGVTRDEQELVAGEAVAGLRARR